MSASLIKGSDVAKEIRSDLQKDVEDLKSQGVTPHLAVVLVGEDSASQTYVNMKEKTAGKVGIESTVKRLPTNVEEDELLRLIDELNKDDSVHGILVQLPLPYHIDEYKILNAIDQYKDVDSFHPVNVGNLTIGQKRFTPCTPAGIMKLLDSIDYDLNGKHAVVLGRSNIVGKPISLLLLERNATVSICHSRTKDLTEMTKSADLLIVAVGRPEIVTGKMIKPGAVVIDVGVNKVDDKLIGDVEFESAKEVAGWITPVPGGVGPMTITMLLNNTIEAARRCLNEQ
ncbi:bifunctional methylenetetrahydrofolate dehydrogenase/methenyltetrahydrofolate cyclohydrolase FolD [Natranaerobius thermophilus]|uniref:Bifunctional protein FolD n=1 Tax=Natranaerobius thermophilus (strain ATCC BAA-1301 / DSM 18059 / JW/NM-WN-LF) TaxID=457570 RepID=FOLD_NATTJ|nr:bifunctional methylenetetrahydrofolate dehydrogenase/methenyltetrahydrofolate cyclohydrolase FolD [Natranaerobius thermophilus]B2A532.1 RecName: Full=Bifunctional protein FolD; Includes: RecName: Full=Methylenetetrahydrofolate dehydrogenase; Includes: RecName: Full=Methenyltetrahydrofolate cyclohydrolase [Natranaerobius thermophilus JW/NM-WN-LF]ACB85274.1 5,10-methylenetetrahydrofolate dehydrogenase (NADP+), Methenyltetrahydrofolate cyclohydrolase [Natranaerobius thermophilus JW/NM-WN-LF]